MSQPEHPFVCRHCKIPVISKTNTKAILGREHKKSCPRSGPHRKTSRKKQRVK